MKTIHFDYIKDPDSKRNIKKTYQTLLKSEQYDACSCSDFLNPYEIKQVHAMLRHFKDIKCREVGGFLHSERRMVQFFPEYFLEEELDNPISIIKISILNNGLQIKHKDVLGSILNMGIDRNRIGDIRWKQETEFYIAVQKSLEAFLLQEWNLISRAAIRTTSISESELYQCEFNYEDNLLPERTMILSSLRLDAVVANAFKINRSQAQSVIKADRVYVDYELINSPSTSIGPFSLISVRKMGRIQLCGIEEKTTRKGNRILSFRPFF